MEQAILDRLDRIIALLEEHSPSVCAQRRQSQEEKYRRILQDPDWAAEWKAITAEWELRDRGSCLTDAVQYRLEEADFLFWPPKTFGGR